MATWIIGDIQGCYDGLMGVLEKVQFNPKSDQLWSLGDLVNRGNQSLEVLRYCYSLGDRFLCTLGNHDLHLLALAHESAKSKKHRKLDEILQSPDRSELLEWLLHQPIMHYHQDQHIALCHAGIAPQWTLEQAQSYAAELEQVLQGSKADAFFNKMYGDKPSLWDEEYEGMKRWRAITNYFTRMRFCNKKGRLDFELNSKPSVAFRPWRPWFEVPNRQCGDLEIAFGHWAALEGYTGIEKIHALDTGYVWGGSMTMMNLETRERVSFSVPASVQD